MKKKKDYELIFNGRKLKNFYNIVFTKIVNKSYINVIEHN